MTDQESIHQLTDNVYKVYWVILLCLSGVIWTEISAAPSTLMFLLSAVALPISAFTSSSRAVLPAAASEIL